MPSLLPSLRPRIASLLLGTLLLQMTLPTGITHGASTLPPAPVFTDVPTGIWFSPYARAVFTANLMTGYKDSQGHLTGDFGPADHLTYAQLSKIAVLAAGVDLNRAPTPSKNPTANGTWAQEYVSAAEMIGLTVFTPTLNVDTDAPRAAVVLTLLQALKLTASPAQNTYTDLPATSIYADPILTATALGWIHGDTDSHGNPLHTIRPLDPINRAEIAKILSIALSLPVPAAPSSSPAANESAASASSRASSAAAAVSSSSLSSQRTVFFSGGGGGGSGGSGGGGGGGGTSGGGGAASSTPAALSANAGGNRTINEGTPITLTGSVQNGASPFAYTWNFGDNTSSGNVLAPTHTFAVHGLYTVLFTVTDSLSRTATASALITVNDVPPTPNAHGPYSGYSGSSITLTGSATDPSSVDTASGFTLFWTFGDGGSATGTSVGHTYTATGTYLVTLKATEKSGLFGTVTTTATIAKTAGPPVASPGSNVILNQGVLTWLTFDEGTGIIASDSSGHSNSGTLVNSPTWSGSAPTVSFTDTHSLHFSGNDIDRYVSLPPSLLCGDSQGTVSAWVDPQSTGTFRFIASFGDFESTSNVLQVSLDSSGHLQAWPNGAVGPVYTSTAAAANNTWTHVAVSWDATDIRLYLNGSLDSTFASTFTQSFATSAKKRIGQLADRSQTYNYDGLIDDFRLYDRALSSMDISNLAAGDQYPAPATGYDATEGSPITFSGSVTGGDGPLSYRWDFGDGSSSGSLVAVHIYPGVGPYTATFTAMDALNRTSTASTLVSITNLAPTPNPHGPYQVTSTGTTITFNATATDPGKDDTIAGFTYSWYFGDGQSASGVTASHAYTATGTYTVTLSARDQEGLAGTTTTTASVGGPKVSAGSNRTINEGTPFTLTGSVSGGRSPYTYLWTFGDGTTSSVLQPTKTYLEHGTYTATFKATDANNVSSQTGVTITVNDVPPTPNPNGPYQIGTGVLLTFSGSVTDPSPIDTASGFTLTWHFGDGATGTGATPSHSYNATGTYTVTLVAKERSGLTGTASTTVTVSAPVTSPEILLTPGVLTAMRQKAIDNTAQWQAFKAVLDSNLLVPGGRLGSYEGSELQFVTDYALGYKILENSDPATADQYADKAIGLMKSGLNDYQNGDWTSHQFLARGDGTTRSFTLPDASLVPSSLHVYLSAVSTSAVVHGASHGQDAVAYDDKFLKVSNTPDGTPNYTEGVDWRSNSDYDDNDIDWSLGHAEPAVGDTYYVTSAAFYPSTETSAYTLSGTTITFAIAPTSGQAVFVEYMYGTHASDYSTLAYQQTSAGDGGYDSIFINTTYPSRYLGEHLGFGFDWLYDYPGFSSTFKNQLATMLVRWSDFVRDQGYQNNVAESNYGAGGYVGRVFTALALSGNRNSNGNRLRSEITTWRNTYLIPKLTNTGTSLYGGYWAEGWSYGDLATQDLLIAALAEGSGGLVTPTAEQSWSQQVMTDLVSLEPSHSTFYNGGDWYKYPATFPSKSLMYLLAATATDAATKGYANYVIQNYSDPNESGNADIYLDMLFGDPTATALSWTGSLALQSLAQGTGLMSARADWSYASTWLAFQLGNLLQTNHQTFAPGQLQIQRGSDDLLIGVPSYAEYQNPGGKSYYSNIVAVDDNGDGLLAYPYGMTTTAYGSPGAVMNDYEASGSYVYAGGDYKAAYSTTNNPGGGGPASRLTRQVVYLRPNDLVVHDRVATIKASYPKQLQWHFLNPPTVTGSTWIESVGSSKLFGATFSSGALTTTMTGAEVVYGKAVARVRTTFANTTQSGSFTTALQTAPSTTSTMVATSRIVSTDGRMEGVQMGTGVVLFGTTAALSPFTGSITYTINGTGTYTHLITDLQPGRTYTVTVGGSTIATKVASSQGTIEFTSTTSGSQTLIVQ